MRTDEEVFLIIAEKCVPARREQTFRFACCELIRDKVFMMKVLARDPNLICIMFVDDTHFEPLTIYNSAMEHYDLVAFAFAISLDVVKNCVGRIKDATFKKTFVKCLRGYLRDNIKLQDTFLEAASFGGLNDSLWHLIGEYAGAPRAAQRFLMERALAHLNTYSSSKRMTGAERLQLIYNTFCK